jgi:hypothetical protein
VNLRFSPSLSVYETKLARFVANGGANETGGTVLPFENRNTIKPECATGVLGRPAHRRCRSARVGRESGSSSGE